MKKTNRRRFLGGMGALAASPVLAQVQLPVAGDVDVAIVGAGAAGIAAARRIASAGRSYTLFEASGRIGGRVWSGPGGFGIAHDRGAHRISASGRNPLVAIGRLAGLDLYPVPPVRRLHVGLREARDREYDTFTSALHRANRAIVAAGEAGLDFSAARTLPDLGEWRDTVAFVLGALATSKDIEEISTVDYARADRQLDELACRGGMGRLIAAAAEPVKVEIQTPVTRIDARGRGAVTVETDRGAVRASALIVTASTNVLAAGRIEFEPALPKRVLDALAGLTLGTRDRLIFELRGNPFGFGDEQRVIFKADGRETIALTGRAGGTDLAFAEFCGRYGADVARGGPDAMREVLADTLDAHFGADARTRIGRSEAVRWSHDPWILGAASVAAPGSAINRRLLAEPIHDRIYLAGEALHDSWWGTVPGAWIAGERAADAALRRLERPEPAQKAVPRRKK